MLLVVIGLAGGCGLLGAAEETLNLTLSRAIQLALAKNFRIKVEEFSPKIAKARTQSESGRFDPVVEASFTYDQNERGLNTLSTGINDSTNVPGGESPELFATQTGYEFDSGVAGLLPWGMTYDFGPSLTVDTDERRDPQFTRYNSFFGIDLTQPLLRNFGTNVNLAQIRIARADQAISLWQLRGELINVLTETVRVYSELCFAVENLKVERRSRELAQQLLNDNIKRAEIGVMSPLDVMQARSDLASREERVIVAEREVLDNENFLKQLITDEISGILDLRVTAQPPMPPASYRPDEARDIERAFRLRPDYRQALLDITKRNINVVFTRNQALPRLDLVASFGVNGIDTNLAESLGRVGGQDRGNFAFNAGAIFSVPIPNNTGRGNLETAKLEGARALIELKRLEQAIFIEADNAAGQIETTQKRIEATRVAREFAAKTLEAAQARLASGTTTTFEVLQFQRDLANAEVNELRARADHMIALAEYARVTGTSVERNSILLE